MTDIPTLLENFAKNLRKQLQPIDSILNGGIENDSTNNAEDVQEKESKDIDHIPQTKVAIFWDYENFPLPNGLDHNLFFEALFPSGNEDRYILKRVYAKQSIIGSKLDLLKNYGFEYKEGLLSGKKNEIDHVMMLDCIEYCSKIEEPLQVVLMAGDVDYISLVEKLVENSHEVKIVCNDKQKVASALHQIIPNIIDRGNIEYTIQKINFQLMNLASLTNYLLSFQENNMSNFDDLFEIIINFFTADLIEKTKGLYKLILDHPDYSWQFTISNDFIQSLKPTEKIEPNEQIQGKVHAQKESLISRLTYEEDHVEWEKLWNELMKFETQKEKRRAILNKIYKNIQLPHIRNYTQRELIKILLLEQTDTNTTYDKLFKNEKDISEIIKKINRRDEELKKKNKCEICKKFFVDQQAKEQHMNAVHQKKKPDTLCPICGKKLLDIKSMENHKSRSHKETDQPLPFECVNCYLRFKTEMGMKDHQMKKHIVS